MCADYILIMGKKDKKKGKGIEKTAAKTEKKLTAKQKKHLADIGEVSRLIYLNVFRLCTVHAKIYLSCFLGKH